MLRFLRVLAIGLLALASPASAQLVITAPSAAAPAGQIPGTTTNDNACVGCVGEYRPSFTTGGTSTVTVTSASPGVVSWTAHGLNIGSGVNFTTTVALPTGLVVGTNYYVCSTSFTANAFSVATSLANAFAGTCVNTSSTGTGTQTATSTILLTSATQIDVTGLSLTAGDYDVWAEIINRTGTATSISIMAPSISLVSNTLDATLGNQTALLIPAAALVPANGAGISVALGPVRYSFTTTTTVFLVDFATFTVSTLTATAILRARRVR